jgi:hypothetical protein
VGSKATYASFYSQDDYQHYKTNVTEEVNMSTLADLIHADMSEDGARRNRYWKSSSLPVCERFNHRPKPKRSRRDKVLKKLMQINMAGFVRFVSEATNGD